MPADPSRALLSLVADLSRLGDDDVQSILGELDPGARARLIGLVDRYRQGETPAPRQGSDGLVLSGWLSDRLAVNDENRSTGLTPHASEALRRIARAHGWTPPCAAVAAPPRRPLLSRLGWTP